jgi:transposase
LLPLEWPGLKPGAGRIMAARYRYPNRRVSDFARWAGARLRSEGAWAHLCAAAPIPASSGKVKRHRLNPHGDRQASRALWQIVITRMSSHPPTRAYVARRAKEGLSKKEIIRCLKRYVARETYPHLRAPAG